MKRLYYSSFFQYIGRNFGTNIVKQFKIWIDRHRSIVKMKQRIIFLKNCIKHKIIPTHLNRFNGYELNLQGSKSRSAYTNIHNKFVFSMLRNEVNDLYFHTKRLTSNIYKVVRFLFDRVPIYICNKFFRTQAYTLHKLWNFEYRRLVNKFNWLREKSKFRLLREIRPIEYVYKLANNNNNNNIMSNNGTFGSKPKDIKFLTISAHQRNVGNSHSRDYSNKVSLTPFPFKNPSPSPLILHNKWFVNQSSSPIPSKVQGLLQLGGNFCLPVLNLVKTKIEFIKNFEYNSNRLPADVQLPILRQSHSLMSRVANFSQKWTHLDVELSIALRETKKFLQTNKNVIFTRADKGNVTVALNKDEYREKMRFLLDDIETYDRVGKDPTKKIIGDLHKLLINWKRNKFISIDIYRRLNCTDGILPRAYGLPKIHKPDCPLRVIVSSIGSPLHPLAKFLQKIIEKSLPKSSSHIKNSFDLVNELSGNYFDNKFTLVSLDVISLFTNVPLDLAMSGVDSRWPHIEKHCNLPKNEFLTAISFILHSTYFTFDGLYYKQTFGVPMGSPLSPIIADITLQDLERKALSSIPFNPPFYFRYVDDIVMAAPSHFCITLLEVFNSFHERLQFTLEEGVDNKINFLDVTILIKDNLIYFDWFHKPTFSGRFLNFESHHPLCHKIGTAIGLFDRAFLLSHPDFHQKNLEFVIDCLLDNGYPLSFLFDVLRDRLLSLFTKFGKSREIKNNPENDSTPYFCIPFVKSISENLKNSLKKHNVKVAYSGINNLQNFIHPQKDRLSNKDKMNVVYKINCRDCDASYVGQTGRKLSTRLAEHRNHINRNTSQSSVITDHRLSNHEFEWDEVVVLDNEKVLGKRLISEMIFIHRQSNSLNKQQDTENLNNAYRQIIDGMPLI